MNRRECEKLRSELTEQHDEDKQAALKQLTSLKTQELDASKQGWQKKVTELLQEVTLIQLNSEYHKTEILKSHICDK